MMVSHAQIDKCLSNKFYLKVCTRSLRDPKFNKDEMMADPVYHNFMEHIKAGKPVFPSTFAALRWRWTITSQSTCIEFVQLFRSAFVEYLKKYCEYHGKQEGQLLSILRPLFWSNPWCKLIKMSEQTDNETFFYWLDWVKDIQEETRSLEFYSCVKDLLKFSMEPIEVVRKSITPRKRVNVNPHFDRLWDEAAKRDEASWAASKRRAKILS